MLLEVQLLIQQILLGWDYFINGDCQFFLSERCSVCYVNVSNGCLNVFFWARKDFNIHLDTLVSEKRKFVKSLRYFKPDDLDGRILIE
ncbi:MAG: hypothetical protein ACI836_000572 [Saprospiraceae bacterium]|jgi:hypothetical protein